MKQPLNKQKYNGPDSCNSNNQKWTVDRFGPQTAVVVEAIVGQSGQLGVITYQGGQYAKATTYEPVCISPGVRVKILGRIPSTNILVVKPFLHSLSIPPNQPNENWALRYLQRDEEYPVAN